MGTQEVLSSTASNATEARNMVAREPEEEIEVLRRRLGTRDRQLAEKERAISEINRRLEDSRLVSESRAARLAERERELSDLKLDLARRNRVAPGARTGGEGR